LDGRSVRKLRQSVARLCRVGYETSLRRHEQLTEAELLELEEVSDAWLAGQQERGFSMAMEGLRGDHHAGSVFVVARAPGGRVDGFLHFVPAHGRPAMSLGFMRRRRETPNGLTEFLVVRAIEGLRAQGIEELSLNFCAIGRWLREPAGLGERMAARPSVPSRAGLPPARRRLAVGLAAIAVVLVPWTVLLTARLPAEHHTPHWALAWGGFDVALALAAATIAWACACRPGWIPVLASITATLLVCDAWFDLLTARPGGE